MGYITPSAGSSAFERGSYEGTPLSTVTLCGTRWASLTTLVNIPNGSAGSISHTITHYDRIVLWTIQSIVSNKHTPAVTTSPGARMDVVGAVVTADPFLACAYSHACNSSVRRTRRSVPVVRLICISVLRSSSYWKVSVLMITLPPIIRWGLLPALNFVSMSSCTPAS